MCRGKHVRIAPVGEREAAGLDEPLEEGEIRTGFLLCRSLLLPRRGDTVR
jgi:hypothetical protein